MLFIHLNVVAWRQNIFFSLSAKSHSNTKWRGSRWIYLSCKRNESQALFAEKQTCQLRKGFFLQCWGQNVFIWKLTLKLRESAGGLLSGRERDRRKIGRKPCGRDAGKQRCSLRGPIHSIHNIQNAPTSLWLMSVVLGKKNLCSSFPLHNLPHFRTPEGSNPSIPQLT